VPEIETVHRILATLPSGQIERAQQHIDNFKKNLSLPDKFSEVAFRTIDNEIWDLRVAVLGEERAKQTTPQSVQRSPVEMF
jgi:beta-N-acetylhexosaminidase